eukprot:COSAG02_NODE_1905_length_10437_cov_54.532643_1_plen_59_part_00
MFNIASTFNGNLPMHNIVGYRLCGLWGLRRLWRSDCGRVEQWLRRFWRDALKLGNGNN